jgi:hypothetical protein
VQEPLSEIENTIFNTLVGIHSSVETLQCLVVMAIAQRNALIQEMSPHNKAEIKEKFDQQIIKEIITLTTKSIDSGPENNN